MKIISKKHIKNIRSSNNVFYKAIIAADSEHFALMCP